MLHAGSRTAAISGAVDIVVTTGGGGTTGRLLAAPGAPIVVTFDDTALVVASLPRSAALRTTVGRLAALGRVEVRRPDGTWLLRLYWHAGRLRRWWSPAGLRMISRAALLRAGAPRRSRGTADQY
ncbi:hypothetical protein Cme02nite_49080 [Catellatospora methionotrophica]|uniref:Uncharacterized protein n=1 Tax=Catellatospora methionotrophica TaxID=121620 RepID=A0A8J3PGA7_9ACTN|nr:hypothetical protein [Catellatospora methionotrophica]GIG16576.1 hypothetical protein Cme02nite_49080 [Catellatospora methionotrophica]